MKWATLAGALGAVMGAGCEAPVCGAFGCGTDSVVDASPSGPSQPREAAALDAQKANGTDATGEAGDGATSEEDGSGPSPPVDGSASADVGEPEDQADIFGISDIGVDAVAPVDCMAIDGGCTAGVFVSPHGDDANSGSSTATPLRSLREAIKRAAKAHMPVFACDDGTGYGEPLVVDAPLDGLALYGGYDCLSWAPRSDGGRTLVHPPATTVLQIANLVSGAIFDGFELRAANSPDSGSSMAIVVHASKNVLFRNARVLAGDGGEGAPGADGPKGQDGPPTGPGQLGTWAACPAQFSKEAGGGWTSPSLCGSHGGTGGEATLGAPGTKGQAGTPQDNVVQPGFDNGGIVDGTKIGRDGSDGLHGAPGQAAPGAGSFGPSGYTAGSTGGNGIDGYPGQGGGGGGASDASETACIGASGSAGGIGGCGGTHGMGGASGGASVALFSWASEITLDACELSAGTGGKGGKGGNGGQGGLGGDGAGAGAGVMNPNNGRWIVQPGGQGGQGGSGGPGGPGAGGNGGPAYAVVFSGNPPTTVNATRLAPGVGGPGGAGGTASPNVQGATGNSGSAAQQLAVP